MAPLSSHILDIDDKSQVKHLVSSASTVLNQPPPPTLREILGAYNSRGDGDRDMLLAMLNAKTAEDQRLASVASLHRTMLEVCSTAASEQLPPPNNFYPTPNFTNSPPLHDEKPYLSPSQRSRSPYPPSRHSIRDLPNHNSHSSPRKRHRLSSPSPPPNHHTHPSSYDPQLLSQPSHHPQPQDRLPPSPYSSSRSDSAEYSPRSRASMAIGSLLSSSGPRGEHAGDDPSVNGHSSNSEMSHQNQAIPAAISV